MAYSGSIVFPNAGITYTKTATISVASNVYTKAGVAGWDAQVYSNQSFTGPCRVSYQTKVLAKAVMVGLNEDPTTDANNTSIDYCIYTDASNTIFAYASGLKVGLTGGYGTVSTSDILEVYYDGTVVHWRKNGVDFFAVQTTIGRTFSLDSSFYTVGASIQINTFEQYYDLTNQVKEDYSVTNALGNKEYKFQKNVLNIKMIYDVQVLNLLLSAKTSDLVKFNLKQDSVDLFTGFILPLDSASYSNRPNYISLQVVDPSILLEKTLSSSIRISNCWLSNTSNTSKSILHTLFNLATQPISGTFPNIAGTFGTGWDNITNCWTPLYALDKGRNLLDAIRSACFENGWLFTFDASGNVLFTPWTQVSTSTYTFSSSSENIIDGSYEVTKDNILEDSVKLSYKVRQSTANIGGDYANKSFISDGTNDYATQIPNTVNNYAICQIYTTTRKITTRLVDKDAGGNDVLLRSNYKIVYTWGVGFDPPPVTVDGYFRDSNGYILNGVVVDYPEYFTLFTTTYDVTANTYTHSQDVTGYTFPTVSSFVEVDNICTYNLSISYSIGYTGNSCIYATNVTFTGDIKSLDKFEYNDGPNKIYKEYSLTAISTQENAKNLAKWIKDSLIDNPYTYRLQSYVNRNIGEFVTITIGSLTSTGLIYKRSFNYLDKRYSYEIKGIKDRVIVTTPSAVPVSETEWSSLQQFVETITNPSTGELGIAIKSSSLPLAPDNTALQPGYYIFKDKSGAYDGTAWPFVVNHTNGDVFLSGTLSAGKSVVSSNYLTGWSGFSLNSDGSFEAGNAVIRGEVRASSGQFAKWMIESSRIYSLGALYPDDTSGTTYSSNFTSSVDSFGTATALNATYRANLFKTASGTILGITAATGMPQNDYIRSTDGGSTFQRIVFSTAHFNTYSFYQSASGTVFLYTNGSSGEGRIYRSTDDGLTFTQVFTDSLLEVIYWVRDIGSGKLFAGSGSSTGDGNAYISADDGLTWTLKKDFGSTIELAYSMVYLGSDTILVGTGNSSNDGDVWWSTSNGNGWTKVEMGAAYELTYGFLNLGSGTVLAFMGNSTGDGDIFRSTDYGVSWTLVYDSAVFTTASNNPTLLSNGWILVGTNGASGNGDMLMSQDNGVTWSVINFSSSYEIVSAITELGGGVVLCSTGSNSGDGDIFRSTDYGLTWTKILETGSLAIQTVFLNLGSGHVFATSIFSTGSGSADMWESTDYGATWTLKGNLNNTVLGYSSGSLTLTNPLIYGGDFNVVRASTSGTAGQTLFVNFTTPHKMTVELYYYNGTSYVLGATDDFSGYGTLQLALPVNITAVGLRFIGTLTVNEVVSVGKVYIGNGGYSSFVALSNDPTTPAIWAGHSDYALAKFKVFSNGDVYATSVTLTGAINATSGTISGNLTLSGSLVGTNLTLNSTSLSIGTGTNIIKADTSNGLYLGNATFGSAPFRVSLAGVLTATNAIITGTITATSGSFTGSITSVSGTIGGFSIGANSLESGASGVARIILDKTNNRVAIVDSTDTTKTAMGYLGGLPVNGSNWDSTKAYTTGDIVSSAGIVYKAVTGSTNQSPASNPTYWTANPSDTYSNSTYGFYSRPGNKLAIIGDIDMSSGVFGLQKDDSITISSSGTVIARFGSKTGNNGLFLSETATGSTNRSYFLASTMFMGNDTSSISYVSPTLHIYGGGLDAHSGSVSAATITATSSASLQTLDVWGVTTLHAGLTATGYTITATQFTGLLTTANQYNITGLGSLNTFGVIASTSYSAPSITKYSATTNTMVTALSLFSTSTGTPVIGFGTRIEMDLNIAGGFQANSLDMEVSNATSGSVGIDLVVRAARAGTVSENFRVNSNGFLGLVRGANVASATTITLTGPILHITGTTAIATINVPYTGFNGSVVLIPDGAFTTTTAGNIAIASTAVVSKALIMTYDSTAAKWYPSY